MRLPSAKVRRYLYRVGVAGIAVAVGYRVIDGDQAALWLLLIAALLGMADAKAVDP